MNFVLLILAISGSVFCHFDDRKRFDFPREPPPPPYLRNMTQQARNEYFAIMSNMTMTIAQQKENVLTWAQKYGIQQQVQEFNTNMTARRNEITNNITNFTSQLPSAVEKFSSVMDNDDQTFVEKMKALENLCSQNQQQCRVLEFIMNQFKPRREDRKGMMGRQARHEGYDNFESHGSSEDVEITGTGDHGKGAGMGQMEEI